MVQETARTVIHRQLCEGYTLEEIKSDIEAFERRILLEKVRIEDCLPKSQTAFLDRAVPDSLAYYQIEGLDWESILKYCRKVRYQKIFLFERLTFEKDGVRSENQEIAAQIEMLLEECYRELGYPIVRVPVMPIKKRIDWILSHISL